MSNNTPPKDEFYIGWQPEAPDSFAQKSRKTVMYLIGGVALLAVVLVISQKGFSSSVFEFGNITTLQGQLIYKPVPMLKISSGRDIHGDDVFQNVLLVGFGKFGAASTIHQLERREDVFMNLENHQVKIKGTLIYRDGKTLLELTEGINSLREVRNPVGYPNQVEDYGNQALKGEIIDPKCYFGVMKPGHGKPHRSCATRCISGGIPPVFWQKKANGENQYFIMLNEKGEAINQAVLDYIGEPIALCGKVERIDDWFYVYVDMVEGFKRIGNGAVANCGE